MNLRVSIAALCATAVLACGGKVLPLPSADDDGGTNTEGTTASSSGGTETGGSSSSSGAHSSSSGAHSSSGSGSSSGGGAATALNCSTVGTGQSLGCSGGDCGEGEACCACVTLSTFAVTSKCAPSPCASGQYQFCAANSECTGGTTCQANPIGEGPMLCQ